MGERESVEQQPDEPDHQQQHQQVLYTLPPLRFPSALSIPASDGHHNSGSSSESVTCRGGGPEAAAVTMAMAMDSVPFPSSSSSPLLAGTGINSMDSSMTAIWRPPARTRSSSTSSDRTQRTLTMKHLQASTSSSSSLHSLTPLASPQPQSPPACMPYMHEYTTGSTPSATTLAGNSSPSTLSPTDTCSPRPTPPTPTTPAWPSPSLAARRHNHQLHHHYRPVQRRRSSSTSTAPAKRTLSSSSSADLSNTDASTRTHRPARSLSLSVCASPSSDSANADINNTLGLSLSHDHHHRRRQQQQQQQREGLDESSYSLITVTSSNPIRATTSADSSHPRSDRRRHQQDSHNEEIANEHLESQRAAHSESGNPPSVDHKGPPSMPIAQLLSRAIAAAQTFEPEQEHILPQGDPQEVAFPLQVDSTAASASEGHSLAASVPSSSGRPSLPYRIPSLNPTEPFLAALPDSLAKLVLVDSVPPTAAESDSQNDHQTLLKSPAEIVDLDDLIPSHSDGLSTPPHSRHHHHHSLQHSATLRLSCSLPASPTRDTYDSLSEALSSSRHPAALRSLAHRAKFDLSSSSGPNARLPLTPLEETNTPEMHLDSPADLAEPCNPFESTTFAEQLIKASTSLQEGLDEQTNREATNDANETFYHTLLELVNSESGYTADLTDLVEVHFSLLSFARFITEEQRTIIVRDAARLVDLHRRLQEKLRRVDDDLGWVREDGGGEEEGISDESNLPSPLETDDTDSSITDEQASTSSTYTPSSPARPYYPSRSSFSILKRSKISARRFKSSDATVLDAARRISAIFLNEAENLSDAYRPFCSGHSEAMEIVKALSTASATKVEWDIFEAQCTAHLASRRNKKSSSSSSRLHFADFLIKPVQRICRYPLLFGSLLKNAQKTALFKASQQYSIARDETQSTITSFSSLSPYSGTGTDVGKSIERIREALQTAKTVAAAVDHAQKLRSLEIATVKLARRIVVQSTEHVSLLNRLNQVVLVGSAHVLYAHAPTVALQGVPTVLKASFYGLVLYESHLVFFKVKKTNVYEPRHWLPLRLFDLQKVPDGEGTLPYAFRMVCRDHTFEIGSLCHAEQDIWIQAVEQATSACRKKWLERIANNPVATDESPICSLPLEPTAAIFEGVSPILASAEFGVFPNSPEAPGNSISRAGSILSANDEAFPSVASGSRPRLSLKPPAQRVGADLRLADLLSDSILTARAQSKRSHAMPLHGPPPRSMTTPNALQHSMSKRPHSFHPGSFSYRNIIDSTLSSRRTSMAESDASRSSASMKQLLSTSASSANVVGLPQTDGSDSLRRKPTKLRRSRTSAQISDQEATDATTRPQRRASTLGKIRRRATSLVSDSGPMKALEEIRMQEQAEQPLPTAVITVNTQSGPVAIALVPEQAILDESVQATVARNSSTSSSSSYASTSTDPSLGNSLETPQSSLPGSPLLTPVDLETHSRWSKLGDALTHTLMRKRSFASQRPTLAVPPEALLEGIQLEQAQNAAEFIYTGRDACGSNCSHGSGTQSGATSSHSYEKRYSWDRVGWSTLTISGQNASRNSFQGHQRSTSGVSAPPSMTGGASQPNFFGGRSAPNLSSMMADKRQASSGSLWSVFERNGDYTSTSRCSSSPAPSIYEEAHDSEVSSAYPSPAAHFVPLPDIAETSIRATAAESPLEPDEDKSAVRVIPVTRMNPLASNTAGIASATTSPVAASTSTSPATIASLSPPPSSGSTTTGGNTLSPVAPARSGSLIKRKNSLSARLRAFKALGTGMTPVRQQQPSRSYLSR